MKRKSKRNPLSNGAAIGLAVVAAVAVGGIGLYFYEKNKASTGGGNALPSGGKTINANIFSNPPGSTLHANAGDTISLTIQPPPGASLVDQSTGGVKMTASQGTAVSFSVSGAGTMALGSQLPISGNPVVPFYSVTVAVP